MSKSKCTKHSGFGPLLEVEMSKKCAPLWREAHFEVKVYRTHQVRTTFESSDVEKVHTVVARSTCRSQNVQSTPFSDHLEVEISKKWAPLWREARFEVEMLKNTPHVRATFWTLRDCAPCRKAQGIVHRVTSKQNVRVL